MLQIKKKTLKVNGLQKPLTSEIYSTVKMLFDGDYINVKVK